MMLLYGRLTLRLQRFKAHWINNGLKTEVRVMDGTL